VSPRGAAGNTRYGESIAVPGRGDYGVRIGYYNILACFKIGPRARDTRKIGFSGIADDVVGH
jgi:hypothetical protein